MFPSFYCFDCEYVCVSYTCILSFFLFAHFVCFLKRERKKWCKILWVGGWGGSGKNCNRRNADENILYLFSSIKVFLKKKRKHYQTWYLEDYA